MRIDLPDRTIDLGASELIRSFDAFDLSPGGKDNDAVKRWLAKLPKPCGLFAASDAVAETALAVCRLTGISVPEEIAVIGVDNDPLLCDFTTPTLTSVAPDHALEGQIAAETIDRLMRRSSTPQHLNISTPQHLNPLTPILNTAKKMVERESAKPISPATALLARAQAFIDAHATENMKPADVVAALGVSRSLLDLRFREFRGETLAHAITTRRLQEVAHRLRQTSFSIRSISAACGFSNVNHLKNLFKRKYGMSMRDWRGIMPSAR
jgi:LacI family transcriptional regulator